MRLIIDKIFVFISYGILKGIGMRLRTQMVFMQVILVLIMTTEFILFRFLGIPSRIGAIVMFFSLPFPWVISRFIDPYVNNNWRLFSPRSKDQVAHLRIYRTLVYLMFLMLLIGFGYSGYLWGKGSFERYGN